MFGDEDYDVAGRSVTAGDCFAGSFAAEFVNGRSIQEALEYANAAAAVSVQRPGAGTSIPLREDVLASF